MVLVAAHVTNALRLILMKPRMAAPFRRQRFSKMNWTPISSTERHAIKHLRCAFPSRDIRSTTSFGKSFGDLTFRRAPRRDTSSMKHPPKDEPSSPAIRAPWRTILLISLRRPTGRTFASTTN